MSAPRELLGIPLAPPVDRSAGAVTAVLDLEEHWPVFAEHFPGNPMLPGSAAVHLMLGLARHLDPAARALRHVRFARPLVPPARIRCTATTTDGAIVCTVLTEEDGREVVAVRGEAVSDVRAR
ncbi:hypothetical protein OH768_16445 [Streptomyces sp. NBC_01622]|uniref:hypothetical protein n=1 Tax=Streptomyces sp. NBC_01622 TaxID=2975903 RepID=UPI00386D3470|nr:hypothetical protein OH768_16445 [Streptomyces sp. NBC_01622]